MSFLIGLSYRVFCLSRPSAALGRGLCSVEWLDCPTGLLFVFEWWLPNSSMNLWTFSIKLHCIIRLFSDCEGILVGLSYRVILGWCHTGLFWVDVLQGYYLYCTNGYEPLNVVYKIPCMIRLFRDCEISRNEWDISFWVCPTGLFVCRGLRPLRGRGFCSVEWLDCHTGLFLFDCIGLYWTNGHDLWTLSINYPVGLLFRDWESVLVGCHTGLLLFDWFVLVQWTWITECCL